MTSTTVIVILMFNFNLIVHLRVRKIYAGNCNRKDDSWKYLLYYILKHFFFIAIYYIYGSYVLENTCLRVEHLFTFPVAVGEPVLCLAVAGVWSLGRESENRQRE